MGTRSITHIKDGENTLVTIYRQCDGYPAGMGRDLQDIAGDIKIVNGLDLNPEGVANGMGCLAAQIIAKLKNQPGNVYIYPPNSKDCWEEFTYTLTEKDGRVYVDCPGEYSGFLADWTIEA